MSVAVTAPTTPASTPDPIEAIRAQGFTDAVAEVETLLSQSSRAFLIGAGCSKCAGLPLMMELTAVVIGALPAGNTKAILQGIESHFTGSTCCTIEDFMSELVDLVAVAERRQLRSASRTKVQVEGVQFELKDVHQALAEIKDGIAHAINAAGVKPATHRKFVRAVHSTLQSGKGQFGPVDYFTLNYDTLIEDALALERIPLADGFNGGATGWWSDAEYNDKDAHARVFKVHGSIDWCLMSDDIFPRRIRGTVKDEDATERVLIWPASTKYREAQRDPYAQLISRLRTSLRPPLGRETVLTIAGYSFGDAHINSELERALRDSRGRLTAVAFTGDDEPKGELDRWRKDPSIGDQVRVYGNRGVFHGAKERRSSDPLGWWRFEVLTRLLGGER